MDHRKTVIDTNDAEICRLEAIADWLDSKFVIPGTKLRFGLDFVLGILPGVGDGVAAVPAAYLILEAQRLGAPPAFLLRMGFNVLLDLAVGAIPLVGGLFEYGLKANRRNIALLKQNLGIDEIPRSRG